MKNNLFLSLAQKQLFWKLRKIIKKILFWIKKNIFKIRYASIDGKENVNSLYRLLKATIGQIFAAIFAVILLQIINPYFIKLCNYLDNKFNLRYYGLDFSFLESSNYIMLFTAIISIGGVLIGLYYASLNMVGSSIYSRVPNNIRDLLAKERMGIVYMNYMSFLTFFSLVIILMRILGYPRIHLAVLIIVPMTGVGLISFVKLGQRAFYLFDPTQLSYSIFQDFRKYTNMVKAGGFQWKDESFQNHAYKQTKDNIYTLKTLADIVSQEDNLNGKSFAELSKSIIRFLNYYQNSKSKIPSKSKWYEQKYKHKDWYLTEDTFTSLANQTATFTKPKISNDKFWIEKEIIPIVFRCIKINLNQGRDEIVLELTNLFKNYLKNLSNHGELRQALNYLNKLSEIILDKIINSKDEFILKNEDLESITLIEFLSSISIELFLVYKELINKTNKKEISKNLSKLKWKSNKDLYYHDFSSSVLPKLEELKDKINYEINIEDSLMTPLWYQTEVIANIKAEEIVNNINILVKDIIGQYEYWLDRIDMENRPWLTAAILSREREYLYKLLRFFDIFKNTLNNLQKKCRIDLSWRELEEEDLKEFIEDKRLFVISKMAEHIVLLSSPTRSNDFPDYVGQFLHATAESIINALIEGEIEPIEKLFKPFFYGSINKFDSLKPEELGDGGWRTTNKLKVAVAPLLDLMDISGYGLILSEFHEKDQLWKEIKKVWEEYLETSGESSFSKEKIFSSVVQLSENSLELSNRELVRTEWNQKIEKLFSSIPEEYRGGIPGEKIVLHESPLVRIFCDGGLGSLYNGIDIFVGMYLSKRDPVSDIDFGWKKDDLEEKVNKEKESYQEYMSSKGEE
ncbi:hypothetical protein [Sporohalobacter salinus]|uniref:hypothetical protein n=1 Tax=Sporohalobacter salinus TaxID=1494606 RepID=UPI0019611603|nr:hypothetical protein [Sporohalobacter salinus]MBM7624272.1 hypothetical protein [Sporohalobacter salinus]